MKCPVSNDRDLVYPPKVKVVNERGGLGGQLPVMNEDIVIAYNKHERMCTSLVESEKPGGWLSLHLSLP